MSNKKQIWDTVWQIVKFILTLGLSHIAKREEKRKSENGIENES